MTTLRPHFLRVEYKREPLGLDALPPRLSWLVEAEDRCRRQTAYQVLVASSEDRLASDSGDLWDSGKTPGDDCAHIRYDGPPLASRMRCFWKVRVWDEQDRPGAWSEPSCWTMGLLDKADWRAEWIGFDEPLPRDAWKYTAISLEDAPWTSLHTDLTKGIEPGQRMALRGTLNVPDLAGIAEARIAVSASDQFTLYVNGKEAGRNYQGIGGHTFPQYVDLTPLLHEGDNVLAVEHWQVLPGAPALIGKLEIEAPDGSVQTHCIDEDWRAAWNPPEGWQAPAFTDAQWERPKAVAKFGDAPWGKLATAPVEIPPCPYLRKSFALDKEIARATVYASALGLFELHLNGKRVGDDCFTPGWTDYNKRVYYLTYDVTHSLQPGANAIGAMLGHGWYSGYLGWDSLGRGHYGKHPRALVQLDIEYTDGTRDVIATDGKWRASYGPILGSDFYKGCMYDAGQEFDGWCAAGYDDAKWKAVTMDPKAAPPLLQAYPGIPVRRTVELPARTHTEPKPGTFIFDLGQNMVGWVRLKTSGPAGTRLQLRHAEMLNPDGTLYVRNLRGARCIDEYWLKGEGEEVWEPPFTFHGFRYVEITGWPGTPPLDAVTGIVAHNDLPVTGAFECSDARLNQLQSNILWGQRGNFLEVPTDCPQRDERLGWTGDAEVFASTACFNMDVAPFFTKWLRDMRDAQTDEGSIPDVVPHVLVIPYGAPAWADAATIVPWTVYTAYDDAQLLAENYAMMKRWVDFLDRSFPDRRRRHDHPNHHGDWLAVGEDAPKDLVASAFFARSAQLTAKAAQALGRAEDHEHYTALAEEVRQAFLADYVDADGRMTGDTQTGYAIALEYELLPEALRPKALEHLVANIRQRGTRLTTGFIGCPLLMHALSKNGALDVAYELLQSEEYPSWLYPVKHGATTIWERWDGWTQERGFQDPGMNSFNHYAFGAVGDWIYRNVGGIDMTPGAAGYTDILFHPQPGGTLTWARARYDSIRGPIACEWKIDGEELTVEVAVPVGGRAALALPTNQPDSVRESGQDPAKAEGVEFEGAADGACRYALGSGVYRFTCRRA